MAKMKRKVVGSVLKAKDKGKSDYIKIKDDVNLKSGQILFLESKKQQLDNLNNAVENGKLSSDMAEKIAARLEKIPDFVRFEIVLLDKGD